MEESTKKRIYQIEIIVAVVLLLVSVFSFFQRPGITGYIPLILYSREMNLTIANSQSYILTTNNQESFYLTSLKLSGKVIGEGTVKAYIDNAQGQKILIYSNIIKKEKGLGTITGIGKITGDVIKVDSEAEKEEGLVIEYLENIEEELEELAEDEKVVSGSFKYECADSCFIEMPLNKDIAYQLLFYVEEGTILNINEIVYTIKED